METNYEQLINGKLYPIDLGTMSKHSGGEAHGGGDDQSSHGSWATGVSSRVAAEIQRFTREWGGLSISMVDGHLPTKGYMVAKPPEFSHVVDEADFFDPIKGPKILSAYMIKNKADLGKGSKNYLGTWLNGGKIYLDVSQNIMSKSEATKLGADRNQKKIWDVVNQVEIDTGGTGRVEKRDQSSRTEGYSGYDQRGDRRLRQGNLGEVSTTQVIYFAPGLKPVLKHGEGDQKPHGNWARYTNPEGIAEMSDKGLTEQELRNLVENGVSSAPEPETLESVIETIENTQSLYSSAIEGINERVEERLKTLQAEFPNHEYTEQDKSDVYDSVQNEMIENFAEVMLYEQESQDQSGDEQNLDTIEAVAKFNETFGYSQEVQTKYGTFRPEGQKGTLASSVDSVGGEAGSLVVGGTVQFKSEAGNEDKVGTIQRTFYFNDKGDLSVEHDYFRIREQELQGTGFGRKFLEQSENYYISHGVAEITVGTAWDGARHWAREGFDFNPEYADGNYAHLKSALNNYGGKVSEGAQKKWQGLLDRMVDPNTGVPKPMTNNDYPLPYEFAMVGYRKGAKNWAGKTILIEGGEGTRLKYKKVLTEEGTSLLGGPVDRDGDGLIYDGTARERPAPTKSGG